jgi:hypothetical protein
MISLSDAAAKSYNENSKPHNKATLLAQAFYSLLWEELSTWEDIIGNSTNFDKFTDISPLLASSDLAKIPYKDLDRASVLEFTPNEFGIDSFHLEVILKAFKSTALLSVETVQEFLSVTQHKRFNIKNDEPLISESIFPFLFPTRPFTPEEIAELVPECVGSLHKETEISAVKLWAKYVQALRGVWVSSSILKASESEKEPSKNEPALVNDKPPCFSIGKKSNKKILVAITNLATEEESWTKTASDKPDLSLERYKRICDLINLSITSKPKPDYVLLPELSIPLKWVDSISSSLRRAGINMIAGTEYRHIDRDTLHSEVCLVLDDDRLGFPASVKIWQPKLLPAVGEDYELTATIGKKWKGFKPHEEIKPVYVHHGFNFGVMICSELQNSKERVKFQGEVDALMVMAWNRDLETFSALVEATALDVHAYTILVNNRKYGDSRVRSPAKDSFLRDLARLKGGKNDYCVTVEIDIQKLREFQSREKRWTNDGDAFKPVPEGFEISKRRKDIPFK